LGRRLSGPRIRAGHSDRAQAIMPLMIDCLRLLMVSLRAALSERTDAIVENVLLRHQLIVLTRANPQAPAATRA
jgi:hypothetical protein